MNRYDGDVVGCSDSSTKQLSIHCPISNFEFGYYSMYMLW
jgi:hypothetical protein